MAKTAMQKPATTRRMRTGTTNAKIEVTSEPKSSKVATRGFAKPAVVTADLSREHGGLERGLRRRRSDERHTLRWVQVHLTEALRDHAETRPQGSRTSSAWSSTDPVLEPSSIVAVAKAARSGRIRSLAAGDNAPSVLARFSNQQRDEDADPPPRPDPIRSRC